MTTSEEEFCGWAGAVWAGEVAANEREKTRGRRQRRRSE